MVPSEVGKRESSLALTVAFLLRQGFIIMLSNSSLGAFSSLANLIVPDVRFEVVPQVCVYSRAETCTCPLINVFEDVAD